MSHALWRETVDCAIDNDRHVTQARCDGLSAERLVTSKHNLDNHINGFAVIGTRCVDGSAGLISPHCEAIVFVEIGEGRISNDKISRGRIFNFLSYIEVIEGNLTPNGQDELMLVGNIELMKSVEYVIPARIRLQSAEFLDDFFAGELYLSMRERTFKTVRLSAKRKLHVSGAGRVEGTDNVPRQVIQSRPQIMNCIADDEGEIWWNGRIYVNAQGAHAGVGIILDEEFCLGFPIELIGARYEIFDVMLGPL